MRYIDLGTFHAAGRWATKHRIPVIPRIIDLLIFLIFSSKVPFTVELGKGTKFSHRGIAVVFHPRVRVGTDCTIGTCVTLGGRGKGVDGAPVIGNRVYISTGAKILGSVNIGDGATVGANSVVLKDVPAGATAVGVPARLVSKET